MDYQEHASSFLSIGLVPPSTLRDVKTRLRTLHSLPPNFPWGGDSGGVSAGLRVRGEAAQPSAQDRVG